MDIFNDDLLAFWKALNSFQVKYIMVGGVATNFRFAFKEYSGEDFSMIERMQIIPGWTNFNLNNGYKLDLMVNMKGLEDYSFDECHKSATIAEIDEIHVPFLHINHLIDNKKAVNRPKDQIDVIYLEKIRKIQDDEGQ